MVLRQGYEFPVLDGELPSFYYHRNMAMTFIDEPDADRAPAPRARCREPACGRATTRTRCRRGRSRCSRSRRLFDGIPDGERDLMVERQRAPHLGA